MAIVLGFATGGVLLLALLWATGRRQHFGWYVGEVAAMVAVAALLQGTGLPVLGPFPAVPAVALGVVLLGAGLAARAHSGPGVGVAMLAASGLVALTLGVVRVLRPA